MKKQKSRKPLRHKALLVHLFCQHMTKKKRHTFVCLCVFGVALLLCKSGRLRADD